MALMLYEKNISNSVNNSKRDNNRWIFTKSELDNPPSTKHLTQPITLRQERLLRKWCALYIMVTGRRLHIPGQLVYTSMVYMHRFFMVNCFQDFNSKLICSLCLYVACKFEGLTRPFKYLLQEFRCAKQKGSPAYTTNRIFDCLKYEELLLKTLDYELQIEHPSATILVICEKLASGDELSYIANSLAKCNLLFTVMCLTYKPEVVACVCIHQASVWSHRHIPLTGADGQPWYAGCDDITPGQLNLIAADFVCILNAFFSSSLKDHILANARRTSWQC